MKIASMNDVATLAPAPLADILVWHVGVAAPAAGIIGMFALARHMLATQ